MRDEQERLAARAVAHPPEQWPGDELADRVHRDEQRRLLRGGAELLGIERQERQDDRQAEDIDQDDEENGEQR